MPGLGGRGRAELDLCRFRLALAASGGTMIEQGEAISVEDMEPDFSHCGNCGADSSNCFFDYADGWTCTRCNATDADG